MVCSREGYNDFLKCINLFAEDIITKAELVSLVHVIVGKHSDRMVRLSVGAAGAPAPAGCLLLDSAACLPACRQSALGCLTAAAAAALAWLTPLLLLRLPSSLPAPRRG